MCELWFLNKAHKYIVTVCHDRIFPRVFSCAPQLRRPTYSDSNLTYILMGQRYDWTNIFEQSRGCASNCLVAPQSKLFFGSYWSGRWCVRIFHLSDMWEEKTLHASGRAAWRDYRPGCLRWLHHYSHLLHGNALCTEKGWSISSTQDILSLSLHIYFFLLGFKKKQQNTLFIIPRCSVTKNEMRQGDVKCINQNILAGSSPLDILVPWSGQTLPWDTGTWLALLGRHISQSAPTPSSVDFLVASQMSRHRMPHVGYFICEKPKVIKVFTEEENTSLSPWSSHNCIHTMSP